MTRQAITEIALPTAGYDALRLAILRLAVQDYRRAARRGSAGGEARREVESFFRSEWFETLYNIDGETLIRSLKARRRLPGLTRARGMRLPGVGKLIKMEVERDEAFC